jgi:hypothetical protein
MEPTSSLDLGNIQQRDSSSLAVDYLAARTRDQDTAVRQLRELLFTGTDDAIAAAAAQVRHSGAKASDLPWSLIYEAEQRAQSLAELHAMIQRGRSDADVARAWARAHAIHPDGLPRHEDDIGRAAFQRWGHVLRGQKRMRRLQP